MAIYTKYGEKVLNETLRIHADCIFDGDIVKISGSIEGENAPKQFWSQRSRRR
jgi:hypothetical protein